MPIAASLRGLVARAAALFALGSTVGLAIGAARPGGLQLVAPPRAASCEAPLAAPTLLSAADAAHLCATSGALIADARSADEFAAGHIAGAVHLPCDAAGDLAGAALAHLGDRSLVLVYGRDTKQALDVATGIARRSTGGPKVYALDGGFEAWARAGLACASGPCDRCAETPAQSSTSAPSSAAPVSR